MNKTMRTALVCLAIVISWVIVFNLGAIVYSLTKAM